MTTNTNDPPPLKPSTKPIPERPADLAMDWSNKNYKPLYESDSTPPKPAPSGGKNQKNG